MFSFLNHKDSFERLLAIKYVKFYQENKRPPSIFSNEPEEKKLASDWLSLISETAYRMNMLYV